MDKTLLLSRPYRMHIDKNRRKDANVRSAIDAFQDLLFDPEAPSKIFPLLLRHITLITNSHYGVLFASDKEGKLPIIASNENQRLYAIHYKNGVEFVCSNTLMQWVKQNIVPVCPVFYNAPFSKSHSKLLLNPEQVSAIVILPVISRKQVRGICIIAKQRGSYEGEHLRRLRPLIGSAICALQSADAVKGNFLSLDQNISDNRFLSALLSSSPVAILVVDEDKNIILNNLSAQQVFYPDSVMLDVDISLGTKGLNGESIYRFIPNFDDMFKWSKQWAPYGENSTQLSPRIFKDQNAIRIDKSSFMVNISVFRYSNGAQSFTTLQIQDITVMRENAEHYHQASQQLTALTHLVPVGIIRVDANWNCVYANDKWYELSGLISEESKGAGWINALHSDDVRNVLENLREALRLGHEYHSELKLVSPLGQVRWVDFNSQVLFNDQGSIQGFLGTFADITERLIHEERLRHVAEYDTLTGLANRNLLQDRLQQAFYASERDSSEVTIFFMDLDGFKDINDSLGHDTGDKLLQQVAERVLNTLRRNDTVARFGGDEFVVLLSHSDKDLDVVEVATKIIDVISRPFSIDGHDIYVTASIGISTGTSLNSSSEQILKQADAALYLAKAEGKNNFQLFNDELDKKAKYRIYLANQLRTALQKNQFFLVYQPQAQIDNQRIVGFEALLRFKDSENNIILPNDFIHILEESGKIIEVGKWVIDEACKQLRCWQNKKIFPEPGFLSINVSPKQLLDESTLSVIMNACKKHEITPSQLIIEITESVLIDKPQKVQKAMGILKEFGVKLALDDFGTGYSSLTYLQRYPFDHIKIDKSFVADLLTDENDAKITKAIIALAKSLNLEITAEGVGDLESLNILRSYGADYFQGFFLGKAQVADKAIQFSTQGLTNKD